MQEQIKAGVDSFVPLTTIMTFNKLKALSTDKDVIVDAIKDSKVVELVRATLPLITSYSHPQLLPTPSYVYYALLTCRMMKRLISALLRRSIPPLIN